MLVVNASDLFRRGRVQNYLDAEHVDQIVRWVHDFQDAPGHARVVTSSDLASDGWAVNVSKYVLPSMLVDGLALPLPDAVLALKDAVAAARIAEEDLRLVLVRERLI